MNSKPPVQKDYKYLLARPSGIDSHRPRLIWHMGWILALATFLAVVAISTRATSELQSDPEQAFNDVDESRPSSAETASFDTAFNDSEADTLTPPANEPSVDTDSWQEVRVRNGDSLALIFKKLGIAPQVLHSIMHADKLAAELKRIRPGQLLRFNIIDGVIQEFQYVVSETRKLIITREDENFFIAEDVREYEKRSQIAQGVIDSSLFLAAQAAGLSDNITMELAHIFGWDIDFALDIREGDRFVVVYEELFLEGRKIRDGNILAAEFQNDGNILRALRYTDPNGDTSYFSPDGKNMRKTFLRTPVDFSRISSYFGTRKHPVLNRMRVHKGVDYAAPRGTAIKATGNGKIIFRGRKGGYGKTVIIQHGSGYRTLYAHMNSYRRNQRRGSTVKQGDVIGYVGSTGLATGPHLHYEFLVNGVHRNPLRVKLPDAKPLQEDLKPDFQSNTVGLIALLDIVSNTTVALNQQ